MGMFKDIFQLFFDVINDPSEHTRGSGYTDSFEEPSEHYDPGLTSPDSVLGVPEPGRDRDSLFYHYTYLDDE